MKKTVGAVIVLALLIPVSLTRCAAAQERCNNYLIKGMYGFTIEGQKLGGLGPLGPQVGVAMTTFDGAGGLSQVDTVTIGGVLVSDFSHSPATGTYHVNPDCTGSFKITFTDGRPPVSVAFVVTDNGNDICSVVVPPGPAGVLATRSLGKRVWSADRD
jgi:hypothetical protein